MATGAYNSGSSSVLARGDRIKLVFDAPSPNSWTAPFTIGNPVTLITLLVDSGGPNERTLTGTTIVGGVTVSTTATVTFNISGFIETGETVKLTLGAALLTDSHLDLNTTGTTSSTTLTNDSEFVGLASLDDLKAYIGESGSTNDAELTRLLRVAASRIEGACGRDPGGFLSGTRTENLNPTDDPSVFLKNTPIESITSVKRIASDNSETTVDSDDYRFDPDTGEVRLIVDEDALWYAGSGGLNYAADWRMLHGRGFSRGFRSVEVVYVGGYTPSTMPKDLQQAAIEIAKDLWSSRSSDPTKSSESLGDYSYSGVTQAERSEWYQTLIARYRCPIMA